MTQDFASRLTRQPIPFDREAGAEIRRCFADLAPELAGLLEGTAGCSPYLRGLMLREGDWLRAALAGNPEKAFHDILAALEPVAVDALSDALRQAKRRAALLTALWPFHKSYGLPRGWRPSFSRTWNPTLPTARLTCR